MTSASSLGTALVTGASTGLGAVYADRLAQRGYDLILTARDEARLEALATRLRAETGVAVTVRKADLLDRADLAGLEAILRTDPAITLLLNNAGAANGAPFSESDVEAEDRLIQLNVTAPTRLAHAALPGFVERKRGTIINIGSVVGLMPDVMPGVYSATKAFMLNLSLSLAAEGKGAGVRVQAVLPAATRTEIWERSGGSTDRFAPGTLMEPEVLVDAALAGLDAGETVTVPPLHDPDLWRAYDQARLAMLPGFATDRPGQRYLKA